MPKAPPARSAVVGQSSVGLPWDFAACAEFKAAVAIHNWDLSTCPDVQPGDSCAEEEVTVQCV